MVFLKIFEAQQNLPETVQDQVSQDPEAKNIFSGTEKNLPCSQMILPEALHIFEGFVSCSTDSNNYSEALQVAIEAPDFFF